ncbi:hypothetical protein JNUCC0626_44505 [Lentzea sp. JNUCC 0626]|uniref:hypothetical protein n=1 Tax=Lentzea sp. JNUCC 0626 TaxID=3367513 RepID=UPI003747DA10
MAAIEVTTGVAVIESVLSWTLDFVQVYDVIGSLALLTHARSSRTRSCRTSGAVATARGRWSG